MNEFDVQSVLHGQVSLAAVNQICVVHEAINDCKKSKNSLKDCIENVNISVCAVITVWRNIKRIHHWCSVGTGKSGLEAPLF